MQPREIQEILVLQLNGTETHVSEPELIKHTPQGVKLLGVKHPSIEPNESFRLTIRTNNLDNGCYFKTKLLPNHYTPMVIVFNKCNLAYGYELFKKHLQIHIDKLNEDIERNKAIIENLNILGGNL